jgi:hypothetical protein
MKDVQIVFTNKIKEIQNNLKITNYSVCNRISSELVKFAWNLELEDEVFISEVLESVFNNLVGFSAYAIPKEVNDKINLDISEKMQLLADAYNTKDHTQLYECLKQLRYITTMYQLNVLQNYDVSTEIPRHMLKRMVDKI